MTKGADFLLDQVSVQYQNTLALDEVTLTISPGEAVGLVGPSGSGKSTLLQLFNGRGQPTDGWASVSGKRLIDYGRRDLKQLRSRIGFIDQGLNLVPNLRVSQNVIAGRLGQVGFAKSLSMLLFPSRAMLREVYELLERVGIPEKLFERTDRLSGGQQQRVALARALFQKPVALIADEPVSSVDPARARDTIELLTRISREEGLTLCMSLHNFELAREHLPRLIGLRDGKVVFDRASEEIGDEQFDALYTLEKNEMWRDGS